MTLSVDDLTAAERDWARALNNAAVPAVNDLDAPAFAALCAMAPSTRVARLGGWPVGFMVGFWPDAPYDSDNYRWFNNRSRRFFYVDRIVVDPAYRGKGAAAALYADAEAQARVANFPTIACEVNIRPRNALSLVAHRRLGFVSVGIGHKADGSKSVTYLCKAVTTP
ncbi:MAG: GNAT family N-acetyltransferase [Thalassobaculaceae bacterium]